MTVPVPEEPEAVDVLATRIADKLAPLVAARLVHDLAEYGSGLLNTELAATRKEAQALRRELDKLRAEAEQAAGRVEEAADRAEEARDAGD